MNNEPKKRVIDELHVAIQREFYTLKNVQKLAVFFFFILLSRRYKWNVAEINYLYWYIVATRTLMTEIYYSFTN